MPAEWEPHEATWIAWPHHRADWPGKFATIPWVYGEIARKIVPGETLRVLVNSRAHEASARRLLNRVGVDAACVEFFRIPTNRGWTRDCGPIFIRRESPAPEAAVLRFRFNGWARYPNWQKDDRVPERVSRALGCRMLRARWGGRDFVLEGGSVDFNGRGTLLTTEECLLSPIQARNPKLSKADIEQVLCDHLGVKKILWLGNGIAGDDTHGHVDDLARFVEARRVVAAVEENRADPLGCRR